MKVIEDHERQIELLEKENEDLFEVVQLCSDEVFDDAEKQLNPNTKKESLFKFQQRTYCLKYGPYYMPKLFSILACPSLFFRNFKVKSKKCILFYSLQNTCFSQRYIEDPA